jgi:hypothetical protein
MVLRPSFMETKPNTEAVTMRIDGTKTFKSYMRRNFNHAYGKTVKGKDNTARVNAAIPFAVGVSSALHGLLKNRSRNEFDKTFLGVMDSLGYKVEQPLQITEK